MKYVVLNNDEDLKESVSEVVEKKDLLKFSNKTNNQQDIIYNLSNFINHKFSKNFSL